MNTLEIVEHRGVPAQVILLPSQAPFRLSQYQRFELGDRVLFALEVGSVPTGALGTVVGIEKPTLSSDLRKQDQTVQMKKHEWVHIVFDEPFLGGTDLGHICSPNRGIVVRCDSFTPPSMIDFFFNR